MYLDRVRALTYLQTAKLCKTKNSRNISWQGLDAASILSMSGVPESNIVVNEDGSVTLLTPTPATTPTTVEEEDPFSLDPFLTRSGGLFYNPTSAPTAASVPYYITANNAALDMIGRANTPHTQHTTSSSSKWKPRHNLLFALSSTSPIRRETTSNIEEEKEEEEEKNLITDDNMDTLLLRMQLASLPPGVDDQETPEPLMYDTFFMSSSSGSSAAANTDQDLYQDTFADTIIYTADTTNI